MSAYAYRIQAMPRDDIVPRFRHFDTLHEAVSAAREYLLFSERWHHVQVRDHHDEIVWDVLKNPELSFDTTDDITVMASNDPEKASQMIVGMMSAEIVDLRDARARLRDALLEARKAIDAMYGAGFDSTRQEIAVAARIAIAEALDAQ